MKILIKNGTLVNSDKSLIADILIINDRISEISSNIATSYDFKVIDAKDKYVIPGGIDPHVHMQLPNPAGYSSDSFHTGSKAAIFGGTTTLIDFVTPSRGQSLTDALQTRIDEAKNAITNYSFHVSPVEWRSSTESEIKECLIKGFPSFKVYLAYQNTIGLNNNEFQQVLYTVGKLGGLVTIHCELGNEIEKTRNKFISENKTSVKYHPASRPTELEAKAVATTISLAKKHNCPIYIVHVSSEQSLNLIKEAQQTGQTVYAETCPHYLLLDDLRYIGEFDKTAPFVISPPLRKKADQDALWKAISNNTIQTLGTDHCPFNLNQKRFGLNDFTKIPNGAGSVEHRLELLFTFGVLTNKISINKLVDITSTQAAKIFGLFPQKGIITKGADADIVIWNPKVERIISSRTHKQNCDCNIFDGFKIRGQAETVIRGGEIIVENTSLSANVSKGKLIMR
ncbi:MAG: dihydropyrimidinase [Bacteroidales bacterium]|nr:dihydropyrimidinase [Bacteroidales bacterium]